MPEASFLFGGWEPIARILLVGTFGYVAIVAVLKVTGARTLGQMNSFDFVITIAMGATLGRALTARNVSLMDLIAALPVLIGLQFLATSLQVRLPGTRRILSAQPVLLYWTASFALPRCAAPGWPGPISNQRRAPTGGRLSRG